MTATVTPGWWLRKKAEFDSKDAGGSLDLWLVHGKWYNLEAYIKNHPGGPEWLEYTRGQDVTTLVETHHLRSSKVSAVLKKYYVQDASPNYRTFYDWDEKGFYPTLKRRAAAALAETGTDATPGFKFACWGMVALYCLFFVLTMLTGNLYFAGISGFFIASLHGIGHNFLHQRNNLLQTVCAFGGWKSPGVRVSHVLSHHHHTNIIDDNGKYPFNLDMEIEGLNPMLYNTVRDVHKNSILSIIMGYPLIWTAYLMEILTTMCGVVQRIVNQQPSEDDRFLSWEHGINFVQFLTPIACWGPLYGFLLFFTAVQTFATIDGIVGYGLHRSNWLWTEGPVVNADDKNMPSSTARKRDFGEHILTSTLDNHISMCTYGSLIAYELLNLHTLHHMFPSVDVSRFPQLQTIYADTIAEFKLVRRTSWIWPMYSRMLPAWRGVFAFEDLFHQKIA